MVKTTFKVNFLLRSTNPLKTGEIPIAVRITLNGERVEFMSKHTARIELWNQKTNRAIGKSAYAKSLNKYLDHIYIQLCDSMRDLEERGFPITAENIKNNYLGLMKHKQITVLSLYQEHNDKMKALIGKGYAYSTLEKHYSTIGHLKEFIPFKYKTDDLPIEQIDNIFISELEFFLRSEKGISNNTTVKYLKNLGKIIRIALNYGYLKRNPLNTVRLRIDEIDRPFLDNSELHKLITKQFSVKRLEQIKDVFVFCCFTGLAFIDIKTLTDDCLIRTPNGQIWIKKQRQKTRKWSHIPLLPQAKVILDKYQNNPVREQGYLLPVPTNQKMNAYLKEIAELCGIDKNLTTHVARHLYLYFQLIINKLQ